MMTNCAQPSSPSCNYIYVIKTPAVVIRRSSLFFVRLLQRGAGGCSKSHAGRMQGGRTLLLVLLLYCSLLYSLTRCFFCKICSVAE